MSRQNAEQKPWREREFLKPKDIAEILDVSTDLAYTITHSLPNIRVGRVLRVRTVIFEQFIKRQERK